MNHLRGHGRSALLLLGLLALLSGCASISALTDSFATSLAARSPNARPPALAASGVPPGSPQPGGPPTSSAQPFATVIRDARKIDGIFTLYQREEKVWIELRPEDFGKPFFLSPKIVTGIGEARLFGGSMVAPQVVEFRRIYNQVQMIAVNTRFIAKPATPEARAVAAAFSPSLLASAVIASQPQPERKSVLVEMNSLFISDMLGIGMELQRAFRQGYAFDARNSAITSVRGKPDMMALEVLAHFATGSISLPAPGTASGAPAPSTPQAVPDPRSMFFTLHYSLARLPVEPMTPRASDSRVGYFTARQQDFGDDLARSATRRYVQRWRLEKADATAALSEPVKPIVYWLDRTIPLKYRDAISAGILEWNKAFERIGFKHAIEVRVQPDDADFDTLDFGVASVRWMTNSEPAFAAIGPRHVDPRSGEILDADLAIESLDSRNVRALRSQVLANGTDWSRLMQLPLEPRAGRPDLQACENAEQAADQMGYALDVLEARGDLDPAGPQAQQFVLDNLKATTMHEVGHTLGLRHNFKASRLRSDAELSDADFLHDHAMTGSVMDYIPINLAGPGGKPVPPYQLTLGPYDYWAIEYGYKPVEPGPASSAQLNAIAARSGETELAFGTDEDNFLGLDPDTLHFDLGGDSAVFAKKRIAIARELFMRQESRVFAPGQDYAVLRRSLAYAVGDVARAVGVLGRQIGGLRTLRDFPGSGRDPLQPVPPAEQRAALDVIARGVLAADSFAVSPALLRHLAPNFEERGEAAFEGDAVATDFLLSQRVFAVQRASLGQLMSDTVAARIIDSQDKATKAGDAFQLSELYGRLQTEIWSELTGRGDISPARRELQREHINRIAASVLRPGSASRVDARSQMRTQAQSLLAQIQSALGRNAYRADTRAHLQDSADTLEQVLSARLQRAGI